MHYVFLDDGQHIHEQRPVQCHDLSEADPTGMGVCFGENCESVEGVKEPRDSVVVVHEPPSRRR